uniref:glutathione transferase n=2 Tax=Pinus subgen. Pinus TaxID=139271 RepID=Q4PNZ0_9CONI|nr:tau class glutathione S-transferase [Pinus densata]WAA68345.1 tau class glutathione S-transferases [Pinus densata]WAA68388.1 tau class glutathione S-transferases [Pinus yunnanensis]
MAREGERGQVKLLGATLSPFVVRVRIALALKGIDYEFIQEDLKTKSELLLQSNPVYKQIPVLVHNGKPVCESMIIVQYIEEAWDNKAPNLMPKDPYDRAIARFWAAFIDDKLFPYLRAALFGQGEQLQKAVEDSVTNFLLIEEALRTNRCFAGKAYFGGDEIGLIDIALGGMSTFIKAVEKATDSVLIDPEKMPLLTAWMDRFCKSDGVKEVMPDPVKHAEYLCARRASMVSPPTAN